MDVDFFKSLDKKLKSLITEGVKLDSKSEKAPILFEIAKTSCQVLQYRGVAYQLQLPAEIETNRTLYFSGIEEILSILYEGFKSLKSDKKVHIYEKSLQIQKSTIEKNKALKRINENLPLLQTDWLNAY